MVTEEFEILLESGPEEADPHHHDHATMPWLWVGAACLLVAGGVVTVPEPDAAIGVVEEITAPAQAWQVTLPVSVPDGDPPEGPLPPSRRVAIVDDVAVLATDELIAGYSLDDGAQLWEVLASGRLCSLLSPLVCVVDDGAAVLSIDVASGDTKQTKVRDAVAATPLGGDLVVLLEVEGGLDAVRLARDGAELWRTRLAERAAPLFEATSIAVVGDHVYIERMAVLSAASGEIVDDAVTVVASATVGFRSGYHSAAWELADGTVVDVPANAMPLGVDDDPRSEFDVALTILGPTIVDGTGQSVVATTGTPIARLAGRLVAVGGFASPTIIYDVETGVATGALPTWLECPCVGSGAILVARPLFGFEGIVGVDVLAGAMAWSVPIDFDDHDAVAMAGVGALVLVGRELTFLTW